MKRSNRNLLITNLFLLACLLVFMFFYSNTFYNLLIGPFGMEPTAVIKVSEPEAMKKNYVTIRGSELYDTGIQYVTYTYEDGTNKVVSTQIESDYYYLELYDKLLVVKVNPEKDLTLSYSGILKSMPLDLKDALLAEIDATIEEFEQTVLPLVLETQIAKAGVFIVLTIWLLFFLFTVWNLTKLFRRVFDYNLHPIYKDLSAYGDPETVAAAIDGDIELAGMTIIQNRLIIAKEWLMWKRPFGIKSAPLQDVLWVYKNVTRQRVNYIPVGKTYSLKVHFKNRKFWAMSMKQKNADEALEVFGERATQAIIGYSAKLGHMWAKDFADFTAAVQEKEV